MKAFTLVSTVFNENNRLQKTIEDLEQQTLKPTQIIITDAGSNDGTYESLQVWAKRSAIDIVVLQKNRCNVAEGRNLAIQNAKYDLIVSTDFGCRFHQDWLKSIVSPFNNHAISVVGGAYSVEESSIISLPSKANYVLTNGYKVALNDYFIPSSRSIAYYKTVWLTVGGYCEWLTLAADDLVFGKAIRAKGFKIALVNDAYVYWGRHESLKGYAKEAFRYGLGDGEARVNVRNTLSTSVEMVCRYLLFLSIISFVINLVYPIINDGYFLPALIFVVGLRSYYRAFKNWKSLHSSKYNGKVLVYSLLLIEVTRYNYIKGFIKGYFFSTAAVKKNAEALANILQ